MYLKGLVFSFLLQHLFCQGITKTISKSLSKSDVDKVTLMRSCLTELSVSSEKLVSRVDPGYPDLNYQWNLRISVNPLAYFKVSGISDIQAIVKCGVKLNQRLTVRGGGHSYEKYSLSSDDNMVLDMSGPTGIKIYENDMIADISAGANLGRVYEKLWTNGSYAMAAGTCPTVGFSGHALGGGFGLSSRTWGLLVDEIVGYGVVTAKGDYIKVDSETNPDLFWALKGAGNGNFGIVANFKLAFDYGFFMHKRLILKYDFSKFDSVFTAYSKFAASNPDEAINASMYLCKGDDISITFVIHTQTSDQAETLVKQILKLFPTPKQDGIVRNWINFIDMVLENSMVEGLDVKGLKNLKPQNYTPIYFKAKSAFINRQFNTGDLTKFRQAFDNMPGNCYVLLDLQGGKVSQLQPNDTAFFHRQKDNLFLVQVAVEGQTVEEGVLGEKWVNTFWDKTKGFAYSNYSYFNYVDSDIPDPLRRYFGTNLERLIKVKNMYDPTNYFNYPMSIPLKLP